MRIESVAKELTENRQKIKRLTNQLAKEQNNWIELKQWVVDHPNYEINYFELLNKIDNLRENK